MLQLPVTVRQVVADSISEDTLQSLGLGDILALLADNNDQLAFIVETIHLLCHVRDRNGVVRTRETCRWLEEEDGVLWLRQLVFFGMVGIVEAQAADGARLCGSQRREEGSDFGNLVRNLVAAKDVSLDDAGTLSLGNVRHSVGEDGIAIVGAPVAGQKSNQPLRVVANIT